MPTNLENLLIARGNIIAELANGKLSPSYSIDGQSFDHNGYQAALKARLDMINMQIGIEDNWSEVIQVGCT